MKRARKRKRNAEAARALSISKIDRAHEVSRESLGWEPHPDSPKSQLLSHSPFKACFLSSLGEFVRSYWLPSV